MDPIVNTIDKQMEALREQHPADDPRWVEFTQRLDVSWIYHDNALEGVVLSYPELNSAIDDAIISDSILIPQYDEIRCQKAAIAFIRNAAGRRKPTINLDFVKKLHQIVSAADSPPKSSKAAAAAAAGQYRKDNPLHRLYFHEIAPPEKISYQMRKLGPWLSSAEAKKLHPIKRAAVAHYKLIAIYPWPRYSGKVARLLMNALLIRDGYVPAIIHAVERQRYYEILRQPPTALAELVAESLLRTLDSCTRIFEHAGASAEEAG